MVPWRSLSVRLPKRKLTLRNRKMNEAGMAETFRGNVDNMSSDGRMFSGWVQTNQHGESPRVHLRIQGKHLGKVEIRGERPDVLKAHGIGNKAYTLILNESPNPLDLVSGRAYLVAEYDGTLIPLEFGPQAKAAALAAVLDTVFGSSSDARGKVAEAIEAPHQKLVENALRVESRAKAGELSSLLFPVGLTSPDGSAQLGKDGFLFLTGGSNSLSGQYREPSVGEEARRQENKARRWESMIRANKSRLSKDGIGFIQIVIPEKLTVLKHLAPISISGPTPLFRRLNSLLHGELYYQNCLSEFTGWSGPYPIFEKNDSHCSPSGSLALVRLILTSLQIDITDIISNIDMPKRRIHSGDLALRFFGIPIWDEHHAPRDDAFGQPRVKEVFSESPGNHVGSHRVWRNPSAPIQKTIIVFGNSFFSTDVNMPAKLSWWFARIFSEYHFIWDSKVNHDYIAQVEPDYVVSQTIERFLARPPDIEPTE